MTSQDLLNNIAEYNICVDSRKILGNKDIYIALIGSVQDGHNFIESAIANGASVVVCNSGGAYAKRFPEVEIIEVEDSQKFLLTLLQAKYHTDKLKFDLIGVTGTNGKTTITYILEYLFSQLGQKTGVLGTVNYRFAGYSEVASLTTPGLLELHSFLGKMNEVAVEKVFMELSSHAIDQNRVAGLEFQGAIFTNLTQDHLDYHKNMEDYFAAKAKLFTSIPKLDKVCAINANDSYGQRLLALNPDFVAYGINIDSQKYKKSVNAQILANKPEGLDLEVTCLGQKYQLHSKLCGEHNALNLLAVVSFCLYSGLSFEEIKILENFEGVCGRLEKIANPENLNIFVDYAHTPDALINVQKALKAVGFKRLITLFGCGGNRDRGKRPIMGQAVSDYADLAVLTSDNPREEKAEEIIADVMPGLAQAKEKYIEPDRRKAIALAISLMHKDDALLIAGKGHEDYQIIGKTKYPFSDQEEVRKYFTRTV